MRAKGQHKTVGKTKEYTQCSTNILYLEVLSKQNPSRVQHKAGEGREDKIRQKRRGGKK